MAWYTNLWSKIVEWISDFIRRSLTTITGWIEDARVAIAKFKYKLRMTIAGWIADDTSLVLLTFGAIVAIVLGVIIGSLPFVTKLIASFAVLKDNFKAKLGNILGIMQFQTALAVHRISLILFPEYQKMIRDLHASISSFMDVIGEPFRTASLLLENARTLVYASYTLVGVSDDDKEIAWLDKTQKWVDKTKDRIERYTRNPELIAQDIWMEVVMPNLADGNEAIGTIYSTLNELSNKALQFTDNLDNFRIALDGFTGAMPEEIKNALEIKIAPITDRLDWILDEKLIPFTEKTEAVFDVIDQLIIDNENKIVVLAEKTDDPLYLLELINKLSGDRRDQVLKLLFLLTKEKEYDLKKEYDSVIEDKYSVYKEDLNKRAKKPIELKTPPVIVQDRSIDVLQLKYSKESWFVGEY